MLDQLRPVLKPLERRVDISDILAGHHNVVGCDLAGEIVDRVLEAEGVGRRVDVDAEGLELLVGLLGHARLAEAGNHVDAVFPAVQRAAEQADFRFLAADDEPGEDEQNTQGRGRRCGADHAKLKTI